MTSRVPRKRPSWMKWVIQGCTLRKLQTSMGWEDAKFKQFRTHVQVAAKQAGLNLQEPDPDKQDASKWATFVKECTKQLPALGTDFEDAWPIKFYFMKYCYKKEQNERYQLNAKGCKELAAHEENISNTPTNSLEGSSASEPSKKRKLNEEDDTLTPNTPRKALPERLEATQLPKPPAGSRSSGKTPDKRADNITPISASPSTSAIERAACAACVLCGFQPPIPRAQKAALSDFFTGREEFHLAFEVAGIVGDHHFRALLRLRTREREGFIQSLAPIKINQFEVVVLCDMLQKHIECRRVTEDSRKSSARADDGPRRAKKVPRMDIAKPPPSLQKYMGTLSCDHRRIQEEMGIADEEEYFDIVRSVEEKASRFLEIRKGHKQDAAQAVAFFRLVCKERPSFRKYDQWWPLEVLMKRYLAARLAGLPGTLLGTEVRHECPHRRIYPARKVPPSLVALLADYGMEELGPAFLSLGISSDEQFGHIMESERLKTLLLVDANLKQLGLTPFQTMMMRHILSEV